MSDKINILFSSYPDFSGNPKALYEYINKNYSSKFNTYWVFYSTENKKNIEQYIEHSILYPSDEFYNLMPMMDIIFDTNGFLMSEKKNHQIYVNLWHGSSPKKKGYLLSSNNMAEQDLDYYNLAKKKTDYLIVPSEFSKLIFASVFNINAQKILPFGYPRDEYLLSSNGLANLQKLTNLNLNEFKKIIFYLPTFRKGANRVDSKNIFEDNILNIDEYNEKDLIQFLEKNNYLLVVKKHPAEMNTINTVIESSNLLVLSEDEMTKQNITIYELLNSADLLIADYSSVYVEYLLLEKPVLFFHRDIETYTKNRDLILQNSDIWFPGPKVYNFDAFIENCQKLLTDSEYYKLERHKFRNLMFVEDAHVASKKIFDYFFDTNNLTLKVKPQLHIEDQLELELNNKAENINNLTNQLCNLNKKYETDIEYLTNEKNKFLDESVKLQSELDYIYNSKSWKLVKLIQRLKSGGKK